MSPGENGRIVYTAGLGMAYGVHTILPSGNGDQEINNVGSFPSWSPNGRRIAFNAASNIYTMRADGTDVRQLTFDGDGVRPGYSPGGGRIAFATDEGIAVIRKDGSDRQIISEGGFYTWAPNGEIAFGAKSAKSAKGEIWAMRPNDTHKHRLVRNGINPTYSPDGDEFLFSRRIDEYRYETLLANAGGGNVRQPPCRRFFGFFRPVAYSPDGRWVLGAESLGDPRGVYPYALARVNLASCQWRKVVSPAFLGGDWQPLTPAGVTP